MGYHAMMRPIARFLAAIGIPLLIALAALWAWSYHAPLAYAFWTGHGKMRIASHKGELWIDNEPQRDSRSRTWKNDVPPQAEQCRTFEEVL